MKSLFKSLILVALIFSFSCKETTEQKVTEEVVEEAVVAEPAISSEKTQAVL